MSVKNAETLAARRLRLGLSQKRVAEMTGIDQATVSRAEHGRGTDEVFDLLDRALTEMERRRDGVDRVEADAFWGKVGDMPERGRVVARIESVARILLTGTLADVELAQRLLDCLPETTRTRYDEADGGQVEGRVIQ